MQAFRSHHQHFGDELIKAVIDQHVGDFITNFGDGLIPCRRTWPTRFQTHAVRRIGSGFEWRPTCLIGSDSQLDLRRARRVCGVPSPDPYR